MFSSYSRSNENSSFRTEIQRLNRDLQEKNQLLETEKARLEQHIGELNLKLTKPSEEIFIQNKTIQECRKRIIEL